MSMYQIGPLEFKNKKDIEQHVKGILAHALIGLPLPEAEQAMILDLVRMHPAADEKIGPGVEHVEVRLNRPHDGRFVTRGFWLVRVDGLAVDISYRKCIYPPKDNVVSRVKAAARSAIIPLVESVKLEHFDGRHGVAPCEYSGAPLTWKDAHVDHAPPWPFKRIIDEFAGRHGGYKKLDKRVNKMAIPSVFDAETARAFLTFHNERANLRVVDGALNTKWGDHGYSGQMAEAVDMEKPAKNVDEVTKTLVQRRLL